MHFSCSTAATSGPRPVALTDLGPGTTATLHEARVDPDTRSQLRGLGLTDACRLRLCKQGEPCIVQVGSTRIGVSHLVAGCLFVLVDDRETP